MDTPQEIRIELKEKFHSLVRNSATEEKFIQFIKTSLQRTDKFDIKSLEIILDLTFVVIDNETGYLNLSDTLNGVDGGRGSQPPCEVSEQNDCGISRNQDVNKSILNPYDADDEGLDETFLFPCHVTYDSCHPEILTNYHRENLKLSRKNTQIIKYPRLCEFVVNYMFESLKIIVSNYEKSKLQNNIEDFAVAFEPVVSLAHKLRKICLTESKNNRIIGQTSILGIVLRNVLYLIQKLPDKQYVYLEPLLKLAFTLANCRITGDELGCLFRIIKEDDTDLKLVLTYFERLLDYHHKTFRNIQPQRSIYFPLALKTAEEIKSDPHIAPFWHWKLRSKIIEAKRNQSKHSQESKTLRTNHDNQEPTVNQESEGNRSSQSSRITPSWLECSFMVPLSQIFPLKHGTEIKFGCSMWMSVCGDLLVLEESRSPKKSSEDLDRFKFDWNGSANSSHWLRLTSRKQLLRRSRARLIPKSERNRRTSVRVRKRQAHDLEDDEQEEKDQKLKKHESSANHSMNRYKFGMSLSDQFGVRKSNNQMSQSILKSKRGQEGSKKLPPKEFLGRRARHNSQEVLLHIISFAIDSLTIEIWLNVKCMAFCARACRVSGQGKTTLLDQVTFPSHLEANGSWSHLAFSIEESNDSTSCIAELRLIVNGVHLEEEKLTYGPHRSAVTYFACFLGCERSTFGYVWKLSQFHIFKNSLPRDVSMYLLGKGPDFWSFTNFGQQSTLLLPDLTQRSEQSLLIPEILDQYSRVNEEQVLNWLTQNITIAYVAHQPDYFLDYSANISPTTLLGGSSHQFEQTFSNSAERFVQAKILNYSRSMNCNSNDSFGSALVSSGKIESVLICFADLVRRASDSSEMHSQALAILLRMAQTHHYHLVKFLDELDGLKLLSFILEHQNCVISKQMLNHYLDLCLIRRGGISLIKSPKLIYHLLSCWRAWHKELKVAKLLYRHLIRLLQPTDTFQQMPPKQRKLESHYINHNFNMLTSAGGIDILMSILRECLDSLDHFTHKINHEVIELIVNLISLLIKHPPGLDVILDITEFLLFLHPDPKAYVEVSTNRFPPFLHEIKIQTTYSSAYNDDASLLKTGDSTSEASSVFSSSENLHNSSQYCKYDAETIGNHFVSASSGDVDSESTLFTLDERRPNMSINMSRFARQYDSCTPNLNIPSLINGGVSWFKRGKNMDQAEGFVGSSKGPGSENCSNRNCAIASIADLLASIVKLTSTDPMKILSEALQKPVIDIKKLIILANNVSYRVREKVLRLFLYCIRACYTLNLKSALSKYEIDLKSTNFKVCSPIHLMIKQLLKYPTTIKMIQLCYGIIVGIDDFETVESVCPIFDIETMDNNLQLNTLILLIHLMTRLQEPDDIISSVIFVHSYIKQLVQMGHYDILSILIESNLIDCLMKLYFSLVEHEVFRSHKNQDNRSFSQVWNELDKVLMTIVRYFVQTREDLESVGLLLDYLDLMISKIPSRFHYLLRDKKVIIINTLIVYCKHYTENAKRNRLSGKMEHRFKSLLKLNNYPNELSEAQLVQKFDAVCRGIEIDDPAISNNDPSDTSKVKINGNGTKEVIDSSDRNKRDNVRVKSPDEDEDTSLDYGTLTNSSGSDQTISLVISESSVIERIKSTIEFATQFITTREPGVIPSPTEKDFTMNFICLLSSYLVESQSGSSNKPNYCDWYFILDKLEPHIRKKFSSIIVYLMSPCDSLSLDERKYHAFRLLQLLSVSKLLDLLKNDEAKISSLNILAIFVQDLIESGRSQSTSGDEGSGVHGSGTDEEALGDSLFACDDVETKLSLLVKGIEIELGIDKNDDSNRSKSKFKRINDKYANFDLKFRDVWMASLEQPREKARERLNRLSRGFPTSDIQFEDLINLMRVEAETITRAVVSDKNEQRKAYLEDLKQSRIYNYYTRQQWLSLIVGHTHERALWFMKDYYPSSWELNPVEGPSRIRRRLRPCKLMLDSRYLRQDNSRQSRSKGPLTTTESSSDSDLLTDSDWYTQYNPHPLCSMIIQQEQSMDSNELRVRMFTSDCIHFHCDCSIIRPNEVCEGEVSIATWCIHFIGERSKNQQHPTSGASPQISKLNQKFIRQGSLREGPNSTTPSNTSDRIESAIDRNRANYSSRVNLPASSTIVDDLWFDEILEIWDRRYQLQDVGLEIFLTNSMTYLMSFRSHADREEFKLNLMREERKMINLRNIDLKKSLNKVVQLWRNGSLTNFDFLTYLNKFSGRSFNDLMQYPVFPFVLSNYTSSFLDLNQETNFRKLRKPMAVQLEEKELVFMNNYSDSQTVNVSVGLNIMTKPYHYGNHYSNSAAVLHFLVRLPPFTQMLIQYQDNNFDQPDRTFHSMANTWQLITRDSNTDFKELIPEFFFLPEIFLNFEQFELGRKQNNELVDDVKLPPWCPNSDARLFTLIHRQALESAHVSENLHHWVDLIFGFKQTGKAAVEALNVFHPATYYGMIDLGPQFPQNAYQHYLSSTLSNLNTTSNSAAALTSASSNRNSTNQVSTDTASSSKTIDDYQSSPSFSLNAYDEAIGASRRVGKDSTSGNLRQNNRRQVDIERLALETMIKTYGQMPRQLFSQPIKPRVITSNQNQAINPNKSSNNPSKAGSRTRRKLEPLATVRGIKWGSFVGSPDENDITAVRHRRIISSDQTPRNRRPPLRHQTASKRPQVKFYLCLLPNNEIAILRSNTSLMLDYEADRKSSESSQHLNTLPNARYSKRAGLRRVARVNLFSSMIISRQHLSYVESAHLSASLGGQRSSGTESGPLSLLSMGSSRAKFSVDALSLISWAYLDGAIRLKYPARSNQKPSVPLVQADTIIDSISTCTSVPELNLLLVGYLSGAICAHIVSISHETVPVVQYNPVGSLAAAPSAVHFLHTSSSGYSNISGDPSSSRQRNLGHTLPDAELFNNALPSSGETQRNVQLTTRWLYCHSKKVNCMRINVSFGIIVTGSDDGTSAIWDLNSLTYVRTIDYKMSSLLNRNKSVDGRNSNLVDDERVFDFLCNCSDLKKATVDDIGTQYIKDTRQLCICQCGISQVAISDTLGDIVTVKDLNNRLALATDDTNDSHDGEDPDSDDQTTSSRSDISNTRNSIDSRYSDDNCMSSVLYVHTINGTLVGLINSSVQITSVCYSNAPEGISVNVIVFGRADGKIRLYSSWDLSFVKEFNVSGFNSPINSLLYSRDNQLLYVIDDDGQSVVLRNEKNNTTLPKEWSL